MLSDCFWPEAAHVLCAIQMIFLCGITLWRTAESRELQKRLFQLQLVS